MKPRNLLPIALAALLLLGATAPASALNLRLNIMYGPKHPLARGVFSYWAKKVKEVTNGRVKVTIFYASALARPKEVYDATVAGVVDVGLSCPTYARERFPLSGVLDLPMVATSSAEKNSVVLWKLYEKYPAMQREYKDVKLLWLYVNPAYQLHFTKREVRRLEDIKGVTISAGGGVALEMLKAFGANPEAIIMTDVFLALQKGVVEGCFLPYAPLRPRRMADLLHTHTVGDFVANAFYVVMNKRKWNQISPQDQKAIMRISGLAAARRSGQDFDQAQKRDIAWMKKKGDKFFVLEPQERARWAKRILHIRQRWVKKLEARGLPARQILNDALSMLGSK